jgi:hypothetical protein
MKQKDVGAFVVPSEDQREFLVLALSREMECYGVDMQIPASTWRTAMNDEHLSLASMGLQVRSFSCSYRITVLISS